MRKELLLVTAGAVLFNIVFWQEKLALNAVFFDVFIVAGIFHLYPQAKSNTTARWLLLGHVVCLAMVILHNTLLSKISFIITLSLFAAFSEYAHRSPWFASGSL